MIEGEKQVNQSQTLAQVAMPQSRADGHVVAQIGSGVVTHGQWVRSVQAWFAALQRVSGQDIALYLNDPLDFAAALWGAWHAGKTPVLLSDIQPQTLAHLLPQVAACVGQLPNALQADNNAAAAVVLPPLDMKQARIVLFTSGSTGIPDDRGRLPAKPERPHGDRRRRAVRPAGERMREGAHRVPSLRLNARPIPP